MQIVCFAGIYMKLGDLMSMFSLNANDSQSMGRRIFRRPYLFMRHRARRMERRLAGAVTAGGLAVSLVRWLVVHDFKQKTERKKYSFKRKSGQYHFQHGTACRLKGGCCLRYEK